MHDTHDTHVHDVHNTHVHNVHDKHVHDVHNTRITFPRVHEAKRFGDRKHILANKTIDARIETARATSAARVYISVIVCHEP